MVKPACTSEKQPFLKTLIRTLSMLPLLALAGCTDSDRHDYQYTANVTRTAYGIPHISADNWGSLGFGYGYAYAQDNFCVLMKEVVRANGDSALYPGEEGNLQEGRAC